MPFDFPATPSVGAEYDTGAGVIYIWNGYGWAVKPASGGGGGGGVITISDIAPASPVVGQLWWSSMTGVMAIRFQDPNTTQWVQVNGAGLSEAPLDNKLYARSMAAWSEIGASVTEAPSDGWAYMRLGASGGSWTSGGSLASGLVAPSFTVGAGGYVAVGSGYMYVTRPSGGYAGQFTDQGGASGGCLGYSASYYGIVGYANAYTIYGNGVVYGNTIQMSGSSAIFPVATTTSSPTAYLSTGGGLYRSTSLGMYKQAVEVIEPEFADKVLSLKTIFYRPNEKTADRTDWSRYGFLTEDAHNIDFRFTTCDNFKIDADGRHIPIMEEMMLPDPDDPEHTPIPTMMPSKDCVMLAEPQPADIDLKAIVACLLDVVRRQGDRIAALEAANV
jgi:hypothetical protein